MRCHPLAFAILVAIAPLHALAAPSPESALGQWMHFEQKRMNRGFDPTKYRPDVGSQAAQFRPDSGNWFELSSVWVPESEVRTIELTDQIPDWLRPELVRTKRNGAREYRFFIHPESTQLYENWINRYGVRKDHIATATSSGRTVLVESIKNPDHRFFAKLSLDVVLAGSHRTIPTSEVARSVGSTKWFQDHLSKSKHVRNIPEVLGIVPKDTYRGGMIIRLIPEDVVENKVVLLPLFSLYSKGPEGTTLLSELASRMEMTPLEFTRGPVLESYSKGWVERAIQGSMVSEDHAQNTLMALDPTDRTPTGVFYVRDGGGYYINPHSPGIRPGELGNLPYFENFHWDYQKWAGSAEHHALETHFNGGFLYNIDQELARTHPGYRRGSIYDDLWKAIRNELHRVTGLPYQNFTKRLMREEMGWVLQKAREAAFRKPYQPISRALGRPLRIGLYTGTFDPPHLGHSELLESVRRDLELDVVHVSPNPNTPHKPNATVYGHRQEMAKRALYRDGVLLADPALEQSHRTGGHDGLIQKLVERHDPDTRFFRIMGDDSFAYYLDHPESTARNLTLVVSTRENATVKKLPKKVGASPVIAIRDVDRGLSSTAIREVIAQAKRPENLADEVWEYIRKNNLYGTVNPKTCGARIRGQLIRLIE